MDIKKIWKKADSLHGCLESCGQTTGRRHFKSDEDPLNIANFYVSDEAKLLSSKAFRLLKHKTQVFTSPKNPLIRDREAHTMEVVAVSVIASEMLGLNSNLVRAAAIGHDIGHVPFGHQGEVWMAKTMNCPQFCHEAMGPIIAQKIERRGKGLNLCHETLEAMLCHSGKNANEKTTQEAWTLRYTDKIAYLFHDVNDIIFRMKYPVKPELIKLINEFGDSQRQRTTTAIAGLVIESGESGRVRFEHSEIAKKFSRLRELMYEVYVCVTQQNVRYTMEPVLEFLQMIHVGDPFLLLALMTDKDAIMLAQEPMKDMQAFNRTAVSEITPYLDDIGRIDLCDPDLNW